MSPGSAVRPGRTKREVPGSLWKLATKLGAKYGVNRTATTLRLDDYDLKRRPPCIAGDGGVSEFRFLVQPNDRRTNYGDAMTFLDSMRSDATLARQALAERPGALEILVSRYQSKAYALARALGVAGDSVDDVVQEAFVQAIHGLSRLRTPSAFRPWFLNIVRNTARKHLQAVRKSPIRTGADLSSLEGPSGPPEDISELSRHIEREVRRLPESLREVVFLYYYEGESVRRVAQTLSTSTSAVKSRLKRARDTLRERLWREFEDSIRAMVPSTREWKRRDRKLALLLGAAFLPSAGTSGTHRASVPRVTILGRAASILVSTMKLKITIAALVAVLLFSGGLLLLQFPPDEEPSPRSSSGLASAPPERTGGPEPPLLPEGAPAEARAPPREIENRERRFPLVGFVITSDGSPIAGARVTADYREGDRGEDEAGVEPETTTDDEGSFRFGELKPGRYEVDADRYDYYIGGGEDVVVPEEQMVVLPARQAAHVVGRAYLYDRSRPLRNTELTYGEGTGTAENGSTGRDLTVRTDEDGRFFFGPWQFRAHHLHFRYESYRGVSHFVEFSKGKPRAEIEVIFLDGVTVRGRAANELGVPLPDLLLLWGRPNTHPATHIEARTDAQGRYEVRGLAPGPYLVKTEGIARELFNNKSVTLGEERLQDVPLIVDCPPPVRIRVLDERREPLEGIAVDYMYRLRRYGGRTATRPTDADGWTTLNCIPLGTELDLSVNVPEHGNTRLLYTSSPAQEPAILVLEPLEVLEGEVVDTEGKPVPGARLVFRGADTSPLGFVIRRQEDARADSSGRFRLKLPAGEYTVEVDGGRAGARELEGVRVSEPRSPGGLRIELETERAIRAHVTDPDGGPVERADVKFERVEPAGGRGSSVARGSSDAGGWVTVIVPEGEYIVSAERGDLVAEPTSGIRPGSEPIELPLKPELRPSISGQVLHEGRAVPLARVGIDNGDIWAGGLAAVTTCDEQGLFTVTPRRGGTLHVLAWGPGFSLARSDLVRMPEEGEVRNVSVVSLPGEDLTITAKDPEGAAVPRAVVEILSDDARRFRYRGFTGASGTLRVPRLPLGKYQVGLMTVDAGLSRWRDLEWTGSEEAMTFTLKRSR